MTPKIDITDGAFICVDGGDLEASRRRHLHWSRLHRARKEYKFKDGFTFTNWLEQKYGLALVINNDGNITGDYRIVDEKKYSFYLLKFA